MKACTLGAAVITLVAFGVRTFGASPFEQELDRLTQQREKDAAAALTPIDRRFQADLEQLLKRATQSNDLDSALKIQNILKELQSAKAFSQIQSKADLKRVVTSGPWGWYPTYDTSGDFPYKVDFLADGSCKITPPAAEWQSWEVVSPSKLKVSFVGGFWIFDIDTKKMIGKVNIEASARKETRAIRLLAHPN